MKRQFLALLLLMCLVIPGSSLAWMNLIRMGSGVEEAAADCPEWGTYGTGTGEILFAWDGSHPSGQDYGCDHTETGVDGTCYDGGVEDADCSEMLSGSGSDTVFDYENADDSLRWSLSNFDSDDPITVCLEIYTADCPGNNGLMEILGDSATYFTMTLKGLEYIQIDAKDDATWSDSFTNNTAVSQSTWTDVCITFYDNDGNDIGATEDGDWTGNVADNDTIAVWDTESVDTVMIGNLWPQGQTVSIDIRRLVIIMGFAEAVPW